MDTDFYQQIIYLALFKFESIINPEIVYTIIGSHGTIKHVGTDLGVKDFRTVTSNAFKNTASWPFQISQAKRIFFKTSKYI